jgi:hypothetical protein
MPASLTMTSGAELRYVAGLLRKAAARDLTRELRKGQRAAFRPLQKEIKAEALATLPKRGGYNRAMAKDVKVSVTTGFGRNALTARVYAIGKREQRDVRQVNAGILRHPTFGRRTIKKKDGTVKSMWQEQHVRSGFVDRPADKLADQVLRESADAAERVLDRIARG